MQEDDRVSGARRVGAAYIHGTDREEQARLAALNGLTNPAFVEFLDAKSGMRMLEVGSGLGLLAAAVAHSASDVRVTGIELSPRQIGEAVADPRVAYVQGDAHALPFADGTFDLVYARYVLEHVGDPRRVLADMHRVVKVHGRVALLENDVSLLRVDPPCPVFELAWSAFVDLQAALGGDALIGRRLFRLLREAGFRDVRLSLQPDIHWQGSPAFVAWIENIVGNLESAREALVATGRCTAEQLDLAEVELAALTVRPDASSGFAWNRAVGVR